MTVSWADIYMIFIIGLSLGIVLGYTFPLKSKKKKETKDEPQLHFYGYGKVTKFEEQKTSYNTNRKNKHGRYKHNQNNKQQNKQRRK